MRQLRSAPHLRRSVRWSPRSTIGQVGTNRAAPYAEWSSQRHGSVTRGCAATRSGIHPQRVAVSGPRALLEETVTVTGIITAIIVGAIVGALGRLVVPGRQPIPIWLTIIIGIVAAFIGTFIAR